MTLEEKIKIVEKIAEDKTLWVKYCFGLNSEITKIEISSDSNSNPDFIIWLKNIENPDDEKCVEICNLKDYNNGEKFNISISELNFFTKIIELFG